MGNSRWMLVLGVAVCVGCIRDQFEVQAPPAVPHLAQCWWEQTINGLDLDLLAVLCEVSDAHRQNRSSATYVTRFSGRTMAGWYHFESRLPVPLPEEAYQLAKTRLVEWQPPASAPSYSHGSGSRRWEALEGCTEQQAAEMWRTAEKTFG